MDIKKINELKESVKQGYQISREEIVELINTPNKEEFYKASNEIREHFCGDKMELCSIVNAKSGKCSEDCQWCSQSKHHQTGIDEYDLVDTKEAVDMATSNSKRGVNRFSLVASGRKLNNRQLDQMIGIYNKIKEESPIGMCASMGLLTKDQLQKLKDTGVTQYHNNIESSPRFFPQVCTTHTQEEKIQTIKWAQEVGLTVCSGVIIGMGENMDDRIEMAFLLNQLGILSIPVNILNPIQGTKLDNALPLTEEEVLTTIALFRFVNPKANLRFGGGRGLIKHFQEKALHAGINSSIVGDLLTTIGSATIEEDKVDFAKAGFKFIETEQLQVNESVS